MQKIIRIKNILNTLKENDSIEISQLIGKFSISRETLRKDLAELEKLDLISRSYGKIQAKSHERINTYLLQNGLLHKEERQAAIENRLQKKAQIRISSLAAEFKVTQATIRKDIAELKERSNILKNHGTAIFDYDNPVRKKYASRITAINNDEKNIANRILSLIKPGETLYLDNSSISQYIASSLALENKSIVVTDSLSIIEILLERNYGIETILLPGIIDYNTRLLQIRNSELILEQVVINKAIISFPAFYTVQGFYVNSFTEKENLNIILAASQNVIASICSSTIGTKGTIRFPLKTYIQRFKEIVTDDLCDDKTTSELNQFNIPVTVCGEKYVRKSTDQSVHKIGFLYSVSSSYYAKTVRESVESAINSHQELSLISIAINDEITDVVTQIDYMITEKVKILIVYINNYEIGHLISEMCFNIHLQIVSIDTSLPNSIFYGVHNYRAGTLGGKACNQYIQNSWKGQFDNIVIVENNSAGVISGYRLSGMIKELEKSLLIDVNQIHHIDAATLSKISDENIMNMFSSIAGKRNIFLSFNEKTTLRIFPIISNMPKETENIIIGHNFNSRIQSLMNIPESPLIGCIAYHPENYGENIIELIEKILIKKEVNPMNYIQHEWISKKSPDQTPSLTDKE